MAFKWSIHTDDRALIKACLRHDRVAQACFYQKYFADAYRTCNRYLSQHSDIMAVVNEGFLKVFQHLNDYDPARGRPGAWIHRIMVHTALDQLRQQSRLFRTEPLEGAPASLPVETDAGIAAIGAEELLLMVKRLPPVTRAVVNLSIVEGYSHREIALELGIGESTSRWHLSEGKKRLQLLAAEKVKLIAT